jgi:hemerythrin
MSPEAFERWLLDHVAEQAQMMRKSIEEARSQPTPSLLIASTGG